MLSVVLVLPLNRVVASVTKHFIVFCAVQQYLRSIISIFTHNLNAAVCVWLTSNSPKGAPNAQRKLIHGNQAGQDNCTSPLSSILSSTIQHSNYSILQSGCIPAAQSLLYRRPSVRSTSDSDRSRPVAEWATTKSSRNRTRIM